jgi:hypothetical protein
MTTRLGHGVFLLVFSTEVDHSLTRCFTTIVLALGQWLLATTSMLERVMPAAVRRDSQHAVLGRCGIVGAAVLPAPHL